MTLVLPGGRVEKCKVLAYNAEEHVITYRRADESELGKCCLFGCYLKPSWSG